MASLIANHESRNDKTFVSTQSTCLSSHSHTVNTLQPKASSSAFLRESRATVAERLVAQNS